MDAAKIEVPDDALKNLIGNIRFLNERQVVAHLSKYLNLQDGKGIMATEGFLELWSLCSEVELSVILVIAAGAPDPGGGFFNWGEVLFYDKGGKWRYLGHKECLDSSNKKLGTVRESELKEISFEQANAIVANHPKEFIEQNALIVS